MQEILNLNFVNSNSSDTSYSNYLSLILALLVFLLPSWLQKKSDLPNESKEKAKKSFSFSGADLPAILQVINSHALTGELSIGMPDITTALEISKVAASKINSSLVTVTIRSSPEPKFGFEYESE
jgi:hypothetical protein